MSSGFPNPTDVVVLKTSVCEPGVVGLGIPELIPLRLTDVVVLPRPWGWETLSSHGRRSTTTSMRLGKPKLTLEAQAHGRRGTTTSVRLGNLEPKPLRLRLNDAVVYDVQEVQGFARL